MSFEMGGAGSVTAGMPASSPRPRTEPSREANAPETTDVTSAVTVDALPSRPPSEALAAIEAAARRYDELRATQRELHFTRDETRNRVVVEVRDLDGNVLRTIPPTEALDVIAGAPID